MTNTNNSASHGVILMISLRDRQFRIAPPLPKTMTSYQHLHDPQSPFFNFCNELILKPLAQNSVTEIIRKPMSQLGIELAEEERLIDRVIDLTSCHPSLVQWLCHKLVTTIDRRRITLNDFKTVSTTADFYRYYIETAWGTSTALEKLITLLMETPLFEFDEVMSALKGLGITNQDQVMQALNVLQMYALLEQQDKHYCFVLSHFPRIVREIKDVPSLIERLAKEV